MEQDFRLRKEEEEAAFKKRKQTEEAAIKQGLLEQAERDR
jgi:hypothetical protein